MQKQLTTLRCKQFSQKSFIIDVRLSSKYPSGLENSPENLPERDLDT